MIYEIDPHQYYIHDFAIREGILYFTPGAPLAQRLPYGILSWDPPIIKLSLVGRKNVGELGSWNQEYLDLREKLHREQPEGEMKDWESLLAWEEDLRRNNWEKWSREEKFIPPMRAFSDSDGIWVVDYSYHRVFRMSRKRQILWYKLIGDSYKSLKQQESTVLTGSPEGSLVIVKRNQLLEFDTNGNATAKSLPIKGDISHLDFGFQNQICLIEEREEPKGKGLLVLRPADFRTAKQ